MQEFDVIARYFSWDAASSNSVVVGVGDDAAVLDVPTGKQLVTSIDTLISGVHFPENTDAYSIGHKALAVNLSDLAAMGTKPAWFTLALTLPEINTDWLKGFSSGLKTLAQQHDIALVGGDTTRGPLSISIQVMGLVDTDKSLLRSGAKVGDRIYVTGTLGDAAAGLQSILKQLELPDNDKEFCQQRLNKPLPRLLESQLIKKTASACIDVSDGLLQDLSHILMASNVGAKLNTSKLPLSSALSRLEKTQALQFALSGGDDYELLFTVAEDKEAELLDNFLLLDGSLQLEGSLQLKGGSSQLEGSSLQASCIGVITEPKNTEQKNTIVDQNQKVLSPSGYNHFHE